MSQAISRLAPPARAEQVRVALHRPALAAAPQIGDGVSPKSSPGDLAFASDFSRDAGRRKLSEQCSNCGTERAGAYCYGCGQEYLDGRLTLWRFWHEFRTRYFKVEQGLWLTFRQLCTDPGGVARRYVEGQRRCYTNPLGYFLLVATFALIVFTLAEPTLRGQMEGLVQGQFAQQMDAQGDAAEDMRRLFPDRSIDEVYLDAILNAQKSVYTYLMLFLCLALALWLRLFLPGPEAGGYNLAETLVFSLFTASQVLVATTFISNGLVFAGVVGLVQLVPVLLVQAAFTGWAALRFYGGGVQTVALAVFSSLLAYAAYFVLTLVTFMLAFWWEIFAAVRASEEFTINLPFLS